MGARLRHLGLAAALLPGLLLDHRWRAQLTEMRAFCRALPQALDGPLPAALDRLLAGQTASPAVRDPRTLRRLADLAAVLERRSPLGLCLRRSLLRAHFLRRAGVPVVVQFGARFAPGRPEPAPPSRAVAGHAWLTLEGRPYYEDAEDWRGFTVMFSHPADPAGTR
jgi:hypothetical protein